MSAKRATTSTRSGKSKGSARRPRKSTAAAKPTRADKAAKAATAKQAARPPKARKSASSRSQTSRSAGSSGAKLHTRRAERVRPVRVAHSGEALVVALGLANGAKPVELRMTIPVPVPQGHTTFEAIGLDPIEAQPRQAFYFDTPDLALCRAGLVVRARRIPGGRADTVVRLFTVDSTTIAADSSRSDDLEVEVDSTLDGLVGSASIRGRTRGRHVLDVIAGTTSLTTILSPAQCAFFDAHAPAGVTLDLLVGHGPILLLRTKRRVKELDRRLVVELWHEPDGGRVVELSTQCSLEECAQVSVALESFVASCGLSATSDQAIRTTTELELLVSGPR